jgi:hypothetical protein
MFALEESSSSLKDTCDYISPDDSTLSTYRLMPCNYVIIDDFYDDTLVVAVMLNPSHRLTASGDFGFMP